MRRALGFAWLWLAFMVVFLLCVAVPAALAMAQPVSEVPLLPLMEQRYCGPPLRNEDGSIRRSAAVLSAFQRQHPCPSTGATSGACPGWARDHVIPLACGGCDAVSNLQWLPDAIKSAAGTYPKDRFERRIYCAPMQVVP